jgi:hypothetical protein
MSAHKPYPLDFADWPQDQRNEFFAKEARLYEETKKQDRPRPNGHSAAAEFSEDSLALRFAELHRDKLRYVAAWGKWLVWTGHIGNSKTRSPSSI